MIRREGNPGLHVLVCAPHGRDATLVGAILTGAGIAAQMHCSMNEVTQRIRDGAGAALLTEDVLTKGGLDCLTRLKREQPTWSDFPLIILTMGGGPSQADLRRLEVLETLGNVTFIERPVRKITLLSAVRAALLSRQRQFQVRDQLVALQRSEERLKDADRRKDEFLAMLAHELRNPLAPVKNSLQMLAYGPSIDPQQSELIKIMQRQTEHMVRLIDDLLDVSRVSRAKIELKRQRIDLNTLIDTAIDGSRPLIEAKRHELVLCLTGEPLWLDADDVRVAQILSNLLSNAAKYTEPGGRIQLTTERRGDEAIIRVKDTGVGIPSDMVEHVFDLFTQIDTSLSRSQGGLGIGLTLAKSLAELHGGSILASSHGLGHGSEFTVRLPLIARDWIADVSPQASESAAEIPSAFNVLVVDDARDAAYAISKLLESLGQRVRTASSGLSALEAARREKPDIVFSDIAMPGMNGYELARTMRAESALKDVTLVALTGYGQKEDGTRARQAGFDHHFVKPISVGPLRDLLCSLTACQIIEAKTA